MQSPPQRPSPHGRPPTVGIVGAGQLAYLLCLEARGVDVATLVVAHDAHEPAVQAGDDALIGDFSDPRLIAQLIERADVITFDKEAIPPAMLDALEAAEQQDKVKVRPGTGIMRRLQNKATQKAWLADAGLPTLPCLALNGQEADIRARVSEFGFPCVQKAQQGGYDGRGVQILASASHLESIWPVPSLLEPCLTDMTEIAVLATRTPSGEVSCYAPVAMQFIPELNILSHVTCPTGLPPAIEQAARELAVQTVEALEGIGVFSIEMFYTPAGELLINEISPRVHNAGHHTLEACPTSQFEQHLRAITGLPLGPVDATLSLVMRNLLYTPALKNLHGLGPGKLPQPTDGVHAWWYGKRDARDWRKVGHVTAIADDLDAAHDKIERTVGQLTRGTASVA